MKEIILDTNIFYKYRGIYKGKCLNHLATFYNFEDLLSSKRNIKDIDRRLRETINSKLENMNNHEVLIFEPHYYILKEIFPESKIASPLFNRIDDTSVKLSMI